nr:eukaryotic translation initiation factor 4E transporter-like [Delphinus delphis]
MLAQGVHPQHLPSLLQAGVLPPGMDLTHLQGISGSILGQPFYRLPATSHPLLNPHPGTPLHLAVRQQQLQCSLPPGFGSQAAAVSVQTMTQNVPSRSGLPQVHSQLEHRPSQRSSSPMGLAKRCGSDVLQQPLPAMPARVVSVGELEYRQ